MKKILAFFTYFFSITAILSTIILIYILAQNSLNERYFESLKQQSLNIDSDHNVNSTNENLVGNESETKATTIYKPLFEKNQDMVAWINIPDTSLSYPVMHTPLNPNFYLRRNFEKNYSEYGVPYMAEICDIETSDNIIIYGHNFKMGKMFGALMDYKKSSFLKSHSSLILETSSEKRIYKIFAVSILSSISAEVDDFDYYNYSQFSSDEDYFNYLSNVEKYSLYPLEYIPKEKTKLITLSTCDYSQKNGRLILIAYLESVEYF